MVVTRYLFGLTILAIGFGLIGTVRGQTVETEKSFDEKIKKSIQRAIPYIEEKGNAWIKEKNCLSCHQIPSMYWSLNAANEIGVKVNQEELKKNNLWTTEWINLVDPKYRKDVTRKATLIKENDAIAAVLLGRPKTASKKDSKWIAEYRSHLIQSQQKDGSWIPKGQLPKQKRSFRETKEVATTWAVLAIASSGELTDKSKTVQGARKFLGGKTAGKSTEWWAARLLFEAEFGTEDRVKKIQTTLLKFQNRDGGWGWLCKDKSDAFGTGVAIYSLLKTGVSSNQDSIQNAVKFLMQSQNKDGSWSVNGTKQSHRNRATATASYWGTSWAVIAMSEMLNRKVEVSSSKRNIYRK